MYIKTFTDVYQNILQVVMSRIKTKPNNNNRNRCLDKGNAIDKGVTNQKTGLFLKQKNGLGESINIAIEPFKLQIIINK